MKLKNKILYFLLAIVVAYGLWKIATHDFCPVWYGIQCLPPK